MAQSEKLQCRADNGLREGVEEYQDREGFEHLSDATRELVEVGLREQRNPLVYRVKTKMVEWVSLLSISAVVVFALGAGTGIMTMVDGIRAAMLLITLSAVLLAVFESARVVAGMNVVGVRLRSGLASVATVVSGE